MSVRLYVGPAYGEDVDGAEWRAKIVAWDPDSGSPMPRRARIGEYLRAETGELIWLGGDPTTLPVDWIRDARVRDVAAVLRRADSRLGGSNDDDFEVSFTTIPGEEFGELAEAREESYAPTQRTSMVVGRSVSIVLRTSAPSDAQLTDAEIGAIASRHLSPAFGNPTVDVGRATSRADWVEVRAQLRPRSDITVGQFVLAGDGLSALLEAGPLGAESALALVAAGRGDLLVGQRESDWLEVKSAPYRLSEPAQAIEAAQDVARLANGQGGLLLLGYRTKTSPRGEVVTSVAPIPGSRAEIRRLRRLLDARVYPPVPGLRVAFCPLASTDGGIIAVHVPKQDPVLRPFLVHGAIVANRVEGSFFSIVARRDDDSVPVVAAQVHALLAGRLLHDPAPEQTTSRTTGLETRGPYIPTLRPGTFADPARGDDAHATLVLRAAVIRTSPAHPAVQIEPRHRKLLSAALASDGQGSWQQPGSEWQSSANAVFTRGDEERLVLSMSTTSPGLTVLADRILRFEAPLPLPDVVHHWATLLRIALATTSPAIRALARGNDTVVAAELHMEARPVGTADLRALLDLSPFGAGRDMPLQASASAWGPGWLTQGTERSVVLEALRRASLDWGFIDPDAAMRKLGWQES